jgi:hypothetical protein
MRPVPVVARVLGGVSPPTPSEARGRSGRQPPSRPAGPTVAPCRLVSARRPGVFLTHGRGGGVPQGHAAGRYSGEPVWPPKRYLLRRPGSPCCCPGRQGRPRCRVVAGEWQAAVADRDGRWGGRGPSPRHLACTSGTTATQRRPASRPAAPGCAGGDPRLAPPAKGDCLPFTILNMAVLTTLLCPRPAGAPSSWTDRRQGVVD